MRKLFTSVVSLLLAQPVIANAATAISAHEIIFFIAFSRFKLL
jgi:hypothetical protein